MSEQELYSLVEAAGINKLIWYIAYVNNAILFTPVKQVLRIKIDEFSKPLIIILTQTFSDSKDLRQLVEAIEEADDRFVAYVECIAANTPYIDDLNKWKSAYTHVAYSFCRLSSAWNYSRWNELLQKNITLYSILALSLREKEYHKFTNTMPLCRALSLNIASYLSEGIIKSNSTLFIN